MSITPIQSMQPSMPNQAPEKNKPNNLFNLKRKPLDQIDIPNKRRRILKDEIDKKENFNMNDKEIKIMIDVLRNIEILYD